MNATHVVEVRRKIHIASQIMSFRWICSAVWQCMSAEMLPEQKNATIIKRQNVPILVTSSPYTTPYNIVFMWYHIFCLCVVVSNGYYPCNVDFPRSKNWEREDRHLYEQNQQRNYKKYFVVKCCLTAFLLAAPSPTLPSHWSSQRLLLTILLCSLALAFTIPLLCSL